MSNLNYKIRRYRDGAALLLHGLSPGSRIVTPLVPDDRYQMLLSRYLFAGQFAQGASVIDFGCGSGFGAAPLLEAGATSYLGLEEYDRPIRHARRRYGSKNVTYQTVDLAALNGEFGRHDLALAFNLVARYKDAEAVLRTLSECVAEGGRLIVGVPLVASKEDIRRSLDAGVQTSLYPWYWKALCEEHFDSVRCFRHCTPDAGITWTEPSPSLFAPSDFEIQEEETARDLCNAPGLAAFFVCEKASN